MSHNLDARDGGEDISNLGRLLDEATRNNPEEEASLSLRVMRQLLASQTLNDATRLAAEVLGNPVVVLDKDFQIVAHSHYEFGWDEGWDKLFESGGYSYEYIASILGFEKTWTHELDQGVPTLGTHGQSKNRRIATRISYEGVEMGTLVVVEATRKFSEADPDISFVFAKVMASIILNSSNAVRPRTYHSFQSLMVDRLDSVLTNREVFDRSLDQLGLPPKSRYLVVVIDISRYSTAEVTSNTLQNRIAEIIPEARGTFYDQDALVLLPLWKVRDLEATLTKLDEKLRELGLVAVVSDTFNHLFDIPDFYRQAKSILDLSPKLSSGRWAFLRQRCKYQSAMLYSDYRLVDTAQSIVKGKRRPQLEALCDAKMMEILSYDQLYDTDNLVTLCTYVINDRSIQRTAKSMMVHRNTINYRLRRIERLFALDFEDTWLMLNVFWSYLLYLCKVDLGEE